MTMEMSSSQRPVMSAGLFSAAMKGDEDVLMQYLGLPKEQNEVKVIIEASDSAPEQINTKHQTVQSELQSATRFGDTVLHLLVTERHNELALKVFQREMSLLKARNKMLETPLLCAAKVGNKKFIDNLIQIDPVVVKYALQETNENGDTALHVTAKHDHIDIGCELMKLDPEVAYKINKDMSSPLYITIIKRYTMMVETMLKVDPILACTKFSDGMFPVHVSARMGNKRLLLHFMENYPDNAKLLDPCGRNLFHIAAEHNHTEIFGYESTVQIFCFKYPLKRTSIVTVGEMAAKMNNETDYEGNTPLHIAAMNGHKSIMRAIVDNKLNHIAETIQNNEGLTPLILSERQLKETNKDIDDYLIRRYVESEGHKFTRKWFDSVMEPPLENKWERTQVMGLGSVLITTVTFAAAFTIPGGYNQDHGTPVLGRRYMFRAFIIAKALAFLQGFISLFTLLNETVGGRFVFALPFAKFTFWLAASSMVVAFGLGMYVTLAPVCLPLAITLLVITLFVGSPTVTYFIATGQLLLKYFFLVSPLGLVRSIAVSFAVTFLLIFCLAFM